MPTSTKVMALYMTDVGSYPRLSREQERELATYVARGRAAQRKLRQVPAPSAKRCKALQAEIARGRSARQRLIEGNLRLVVYWARRHNPYDLPIEDLIQEGSVGLIKAIERYDPQQGTRLSTYAQWWIKKALYQAVTDLGPLIRLPEKANQERLRLRRAASRLQQSLAREPTPAELAAEMDVPLSRVATVKRWDHRYTSLDAPLGPNTESSLGDVLPDDSRLTPDETATHGQLAVHLREAMIAHLAPNEQTYLQVRFGLNGASPRTQLQAAHHLGITQKHAAQLEKRALRRLRQSQVLRDWRA
jgi:RNA polymerase sigma factor (sigma-70 family)